MDPCGNPARISIQEEHWPFKSTPCFLLVMKSFRILIKSRHIPFWHNWKSVQHVRLYKRLLRHQGVTLKFQNLISKTFRVSWLIEIRCLFKFKMIIYKERTCKVFRNCSWVNSLITFSFKTLAQNCIVSFEIF